MILRQSARSLVLLGLMCSPVAAVAQNTDPVMRPLWDNGAQQVTVLDSFPKRLNSYQMISFPLDPAPNTVSAIFDELGGYNQANWRLGHWNPSLTGTRKYEEPGAFTTIRLGHGYWLITRDSTRVRFDGTSAATDTVELPLFQGPTGAAEWNQVGNPFPFNSAVANWRLVKRDSLLTLGSAATQNWIDANMRTYNATTGTYTASGTIPRGAGFWSRLVDRDTSQQWTRWVAEDTTGSGFWSSVKFDSKGNPHISFFTAPGGLGHLRYVTRKNSRWIKTIVANQTGSESGVFSSIALDSLDLPFIAHQSWGPQKPIFTRKLPSGVWTAPEEIDPLPGTPSNGWGIKIELFHGSARVAYGDRNGTTPMIKYAEKGVAGWVVDTVSFLGSVPNQSTHDLGFDIAPNGVPHIATTTADIRGLRYFTRVGNNWSTELVDTLPGGFTGHAPSLILDAAGVPHISYFDNTNIDLKYARRTGPNAWSVETVDATGTTGNFSEVLIQSNGQPAVAYLEYTSMGVPTRIRYARRTGAGSWQIETVDDVNVSSSQAYLGATIDPLGNPVVTYQGINGSFRQLRYAEKIRGNWRIKVPPVAAPEPLAASETKPEGADWALSITARQESRLSEPMFLGVARADAVSGLRSWKAPAPPDDRMLSVSVPRGEESFVRDFQTSAETVRWTFATEGGVAPGEQTFEVAGFDLPRNLRLFLSDHDNGWTREVRAGESVTLAARPRTLELVATTGDQVPAATVIRDGLSFAYPNPFARNTGLAFTMARRGDIRVDLYDITGRRIATMERAGASAGEHVLTWDGRDEGGRPLPSGIYMAAWRAGDAKGSRRLVKVE